VADPKYFGALANSKTLLRRNTIKDLQRIAQRTGIGGLSSCACLPCQARTQHRRNTRNGASC